MLNGVVDATCFASCMCLFSLSKVKRRAFHLRDVCCWLMMVGHAFVLKQ